MKITKKIAAAAVSGLMVAVSTAGTMTYAVDTNTLGGVTIAADEVKAKIYDAKASLTVGEATAVAGGTVSIPVYLAIPDNDFITGVAFKAVYDKTALELTSITESSTPALSEARIDSWEGSGIFSCTWSTKDITVDKTKPICYYNFKVKNTASGEYPIKLINHLVNDNSKPVEIIHTQEVHKDATYYEPTITNGSVSVMSSEVSSAIAAKKYDGTAYIRLEQNVQAAPGSTVDVPVYMELGKDVDGKFITGVGFKVSCDSDLQLTDITVPAKSGLDGGEVNINVEKKVFLYESLTDENVTVDPTNPVCVLRFKVKDGASGKYLISLTNHLPENNMMPIEVIHKQTKDATFLTPVVTKGSVIVSGEPVTTDVNDEPTTKPTPTTSPSKDDKPTDPVNYDLLYWGDVNLDEYVDLADVTTLSKYLLSKKAYPLINSTAWENADCKYDQKIDSSDLSKLIEYNLKKITIDKLGPEDPALRRKSKRYQ